MTKGCPGWSQYQAFAGTSGKRRLGGPDEALTALYKWRMKYDPARVIPYAGRTGATSVMKTVKRNSITLARIPWSGTTSRANLSTQVNYKSSERSLARLPKSGQIPPQPPFKPKEPVNTKISAEAWKDKYFSRHPKADTNKDGKLTWQEYKAYRDNFATCEARN